MKELRWVGSSHRDLQEFPDVPRREMGFALYQAQIGMKHIHAKPFKGLEGGVMEVVSDYDGDTYRGIYTVKIGGCIYVLHTFQKKSKKGIKTPPQDTEVIRQRLKEAKRDAEAKRQ